MTKQNETKRYLEEINSPADLRRLPESALKLVCDEIRELLIDSISRTGGHLGSGLGTVELAVALHYVFQTPDDRLIWDVGHQAYPHKIITGRRERFHTIRQFKGLSGFLKRDESEYDPFGAGHASTSISAALGIACARDYDASKRKVIAVIGDGAMTGGMAYEAMNNTGLLKKNVIVVFNDNNMSISPNKSALSNYFNDLITSPAYNRLRANVWDIAGKFDDLGDRFRKVTSRVEGGLKSILTPGMLFEALGFRYFGPIHGHNVLRLIRLFKEVKNLPGPILVHVITQKGKGYKPAEDDETHLHGVNPFDKTTGKSPVKICPPSYTSVFGHALAELAGKDKRIIGITAAMAPGTGLDIFFDAHPDKYFDVGIAEQHAVTFAAGLATEGYAPVVAIYSTFLQRAFDQIIHDVALQRLHVVFAIDRAGLVGADGPTHHGAFDLSYLRIVPGMVIMAPRDEQELRDMLHTAVTACDGPVAVRYPRGNATGKLLRSDFRTLAIGESETLRQGQRCAIIAIGTMVGHSLEAADILASHGMECTVVDARFLKPFDEAMVDRITASHELIVTVEDNTITGGLGSVVAEYLTRKNQTRTRLCSLGLPDDFVEHGTQTELFEMLQLHPAGIAAQIMNLLDMKAQ
jgi:1-deoxy-D-xylulose-5-phosphate synthase